MVSKIALARYVTFRASTMRSIIDQYYREASRLVHAPSEEVVVCGLVRCWRKSIVVRERLIGRLIKERANDR